MKTYSLVDYNLIVHILGDLPSLLLDVNVQKLKPACPIWPKLPFKILRYKILRPKRKRESQGFV